MKIILASGSPRRKELLQQIGLEFEIIVSNVEENADLSNGIYEYMKTLAHIKAQEVFNRIQGNKTVIGADTVVYFEDKILGKPKTEDIAYEMLKELQGKKCRVITGLCVISNEQEVVKEYLETSECEVNLQKMTDNEIWEYIKTGEPLDKAGAFAIQEIGAKYIESISGDYYSVVGLPINKLYNILKNLKGENI